MKIDRVWVIAFVVGRDDSVSLANAKRYVPT